MSALDDSEAGRICALSHIAIQSYTVFQLTRKYINDVDEALAQGRVCP